MSEAKRKKITRIMVKPAEGAVRLSIGPKVLELMDYDGKFFIYEPGSLKDGRPVDGEKAIQILDGASLVIGRRELAALCFDLPDSISRHHMLVKREGDTVFVFDLHSKNGTFVLED